MMLEGVTLSDRDRALLQSAAEHLRQFGGRRWRVHRYVYAVLVGPIPEGMVIDHLCRSKACANPDHLRAVTQSANVTAGLTHSCGHDEWYVYPGSGERTCHPCKLRRQREAKAAKR